MISNLLTASGGVNLDTLTAIRLIVGVQLYTPDTSEEELEQIIDVGVGVCSVEAFNVGVTALPDPNTVGDYPPRGWLWVDRYLVLQALPTGATPTAMWRIQPRIQVDMRAARKVDKGVVFMIWRNTQVGTDAASIVLSGRVRLLCLT